MTEMKFNQKTFGLKYITTERSVEMGGPIKTVMILLDGGEVYGEFDAKGFHKWLVEKTKEMDEWIVSGHVKKWYAKKGLKEKSNDNLRYMG